MRHTGGEFTGGVARGAGVSVGKAIGSAVLAAVLGFFGGCGVGQALDNPVPAPQQFEQEDDD